MWYSLRLTGNRSLSYLCSCWMSRGFFGGRAQVSHSSGRHQGDADLQETPRGHPRAPSPAGGDAETGAWLARRAESLRAGTVVGGTAVVRDEAVARLAARIT